MPWNYWGMWKICEPYPDRMRWTWGPIGKEKGGMHSVLMEHIGWWWRTSPKWTNSIEIQPASHQPGNKILIKTTRQRALWAQPFWDPSHVYGSFSTPFPLCLSKTLLFCSSCCPWFSFFDRTRQFPASTMAHLRPDSCNRRIGVWTQGFAFARQALYHLNHTFSPGILFLHCSLFLRIMLCIFSRRWPSLAPISIPPIQCEFLLPVLHAIKHCSR
jgi:hypothetical protein